MTFVLRVVSNFLKLLRELALLLRAGAVHMAIPARRILVTGANKGIGLATCTKLLREHPDSFLLLGSRDVRRGEAAVRSILDNVPGSAGRIECLQIDVADDASCTAAAAALKAKGVTLYALVNNAGVGLAQVEAASASTEHILNVNFLGPDWA